MDRIRTGLLRFLTARRELMADATAQTIGRALLGDRESGRDAALRLLGFLLPRRSQEFVTEVLGAAMKDGSGAQLGVQVLRRLEPDWLADALPEAIDSITSSLRPSADEAARLVSVLDQLGQQAGIAVLERALRRVLP